MIIGQRSGSQGETTATAMANAGGLWRMRLNYDRNCVLT